MADIATYADTVNLLRSWSLATANVNRVFEDKRRFNIDLRLAKAKAAEANREKTVAKNGNAKTKRAITRSKREIGTSLAAINRFRFLSVSRRVEVEVIGGLLELGDFVGGVLLADGLTDGQERHLRLAPYQFHVPVMN